MGFQIWHMPERTRAVGCEHCDGAGPEAGWIEQDNNGPIVSCPICNRDGEKNRAWEMALAEKAMQEGK